MDIVIDKTLLTDQRVASAIREANFELERDLGPSAGLARAEWTRDTDERGRPLYTLQLSDFTGEVKTFFTPEELLHPLRVKDRLYRLWGDLLQVRSHKQVRDLLQAVREGEGG